MMVIILQKIVVRNVRSLILLLWVFLDVQKMQKKLSITLKKKTELVLPLGDLSYQGSEDCWFDVMRNRCYEKFYCSQYFFVQELFTLFPRTRRILNCLLTIRILDVIFYQVCTVSVSVTWIPFRLPLAITLVSIVGPLTPITL
jgi:hypothetical protein